MSEELYDIRDHPDHEAMLEPWAQRWIHNAMCTDPTDKPRMIRAMEGLYRAAKLPPPELYWFVQSPMAAAIEATITAGARWLERNPGQQQEIFSRTLRPDQIENAKADAIWIADVLGRVALSGDPGPDTRPDRSDLVQFLLQCTRYWPYMHNGGSDWSGGPAHLSFFKYVAKLDLPEYDKWAHYEDAALAGASRMMHDDFWVVSDRHVEVHTDDQSRLHNSSGPARRWGDGWAIWSWHGTRVPRSLIEDGWDAATIMAEPNSEVRRCAVEHRAKGPGGWVALISEAGWPQVGQTVPDPGNPGQTLSLWDVGELYEEGESVLLLLMHNGMTEKNGGRREFGETVPAGVRDPVAAAAWQIGLTAEQYATSGRRT